MLAIPLIPADGVEVCGQVIQRSRNVSTPRNFQQSPGFSQCTFEIRQSSDCSPDCLARINFHVLLVGAFDGESCTTSSSFMTISEGPHITTGRFCGEVQQERDYFTEFLPAKITFVKGAADDRGVDFAFDVSYMRKSELTVRAGPRPDLYPHVRGDLVTNTFCERVFRDCSRQQACFVQSPGYPGMYLIEWGLARTPLTTSCCRRLSSPTGLSLLHQLQGAPGQHVRGERVRQRL